MILNVPDAPIERVEVLFGHQKQRSPPFGPELVCPERLSDRPWAVLP